MLSSMKCSEGEKPFPFSVNKKWGDLHLTDKCLARSCLLARSGWAFVYLFKTDPINTMLETKSLASEEEPFAQFVSAMERFVNNT